MFFFGGGFWNKPYTDGDWCEFALHTQSHTHIMCGCCIASLMHKHRCTDKSEAGVNGLKATCFYLIYNAQFLSKHWFYKRATEQQTTIPATEHQFQFNFKDLKCFVSPFALSLSLSLPIQFVILSHKFVLSILENCNYSKS